jgi:hypothetical protein
MTQSSEEPSSVRGADDRPTRHGGLSYLEIPALSPRRSASLYEHVFG